MLLHSLRELVRGHPPVLVVMLAERPPVLAVQQGPHGPPGAERRAILHAITDGIVARKEEIAFLECLDTGQSLRFMSKAALRAADNFRFFADRAPGARDGQSLYGNNQINMTNRVPLGPVGVITPWNTPFMLSTWKIAPALACGCTVVHKPAEFSPLTRNPYNRR